MGALIAAGYLTANQQLRQYVIYLVLSIVIGYLLLKLNTSASYELIGYFYTIFSILATAVGFVLMYKISKDKLRH